MSTLTSDQIYDIFRKTGTMREGHFLLTSGRHSNRFFLMPHTFQFPEQAERICRALAELFADQQVDTVVGPATGGILLAYEVARQLGQLNQTARPGSKAPRAIFCEKTDDGKMALKRQWNLSPGERVLVVEDAVTTGGSVFKCIDAIMEYQPTIVGVATVADRSGGTVQFPAPLKTLITLTVDSWTAEECPLCRQGIALTKPKG